jgi:RNA polymerase sigma-70 factor (ECF subfamily)
MSDEKETAARAARSQLRAALMARLQQGDRDACRALLDDIGPAVMQFLRKRIANREELEDVYQEVFMALYEARRSYEPGRPLEPWLFAIARNIAADHTRHYWSRARWEELSADPPEIADSTAPEAPPNLEQALTGLPPAQREAFTMLKLDGMSLEGAAARAGVSVAAMKVRAHRAYKALRELIGREK